MKPRVAIFLGWLIAVLAVPGPVYSAVPEYTGVVIKTYPHDPKAFTEGLLYSGGFLYESTGRAGQSFIRKVRLESGEVLQQRAIDPQYFGEGIVIWQDKLIELTWKNELGFIYDATSFDLKSDFHYPGEGWALTHDGHNLIMSDGTSDLRVLDPDTLKERNRIHVTCDGRPIRYINEIEWVKGEVLANIWLTNVIVRIDPATGKVVGLIDLTDIANAVVKNQGDNVLNGIAYDSAADRLFVTGKLWPKLLQIKLAPRQKGRNLCQALPKG